MKLRFALSFVFAVCFIFGAKAELAIDVSGAMRDPMPIALPEMIHDGFFIGQQGKKILDVVEADLERSGLFEVVDKGGSICGEERRRKTL